MNATLEEPHQTPRRRFLTVEQAAEELNVGLPTVRALLSAGELRGFQVGGRGLWRIGSVDLEEYIASAYAHTADRIAQGELGEERPDRSTWSNM